MCAAIPKTPRSTDADPAVGGVVALLDELVAPVSAYDQFTSETWRISQRIRELITLMVLGKLTSEQRYELHKLQIRRGELMLPRYFRDYRRGANFR